jgi:hypothetical protein
VNSAHQVDALTTSLFALLRIWEAVVRRHWFPEALDALAPEHVAAVPRSSP